MSWIEIEPERRQAPRRDAGLASYLLVNGIPYKCRILDLSDTGAKVQMTKALFLRGAIALGFAGEQEELACEIAWRSGTELGLRFLYCYEGLFD